MRRWLDKPLTRGGLIVGYTIVGLLCFCAGRASADVFEVEVNAQRDGWARLHAHGLWVDRNPALGRYSVMASAGKETTRRIRVEKGPNTIRIRAVRWEDEDIPFEDRLARMLGSSGAIPVVKAPVNAAFVWGRVAGREIERTLNPTDSQTILPPVPDEG